MEKTPVSTVFLRNGGEVLLFRRSEDVGSYPGQWGGVAGHVEEDPTTAARREIREETGVGSNAITFVRAGEAFNVEDSALETRWKVHPFLFDCETRSVETNWETRDAEWAPPTVILDRETVPKLWQSYDRVRPSVDTIRDDSRHGSAYISLRALEVLRDEAALRAREITGLDQDSRESIAAVARNLRDARPTMTVLENRINRVMETAGDSPAQIEQTAQAVLRDAVGADSAAAQTAAEFLPGRLATLSRSGTVLQAIEEASPSAVLVAESRPGGEGVAVAEHLAAETDVTLTADTAFLSQLTEWGAEALVVGADSILADGSVVNKVGTRPAAIVAEADGIQFIVVAARDKVRGDTAWEGEPRPAAEMYDGERDVSVANPTFDVTPAAYVDRLVTEDGTCELEDVRQIAAEHRTLATWDKPDGENTRLRDPDSP